PATGSSLANQLSDDYSELMRRSENWRNVINPQTGYADGRHIPTLTQRGKKGKNPSSSVEEGAWENNKDLVHRKPYITEGATCHYTWYVPQNMGGLIDLMGGHKQFVQRLDSMFTEGRYWHGNEPCHQVAWLYSMAGQPEKTRQRVSHILKTEYNDSPGGLSGNDDAGQMSAWQVFASLGFYPVCPATPDYVLGGAQFQQVTINQPGGKPFVISRSPDASYRLNGKPLSAYSIRHADIVNGGELLLPKY
ncbi:MAG: glycoside hydrolase domain-containing protein, partial [Prevotella sp.]